MTERKSDLLRLAGLGPQLVGCIVVGWALGYLWLDPWLETFPLFTVVFILLGVLAGFIELYRELRFLERSEREAAEDADEEG